MRRLLASALTGCLLLTACNPPSQNNYGEADVGQNAIILYGIVKSVRAVAITGQNSGAGAVAGTAGGAVLGSAIGRGNGSLIGLVAGAVVGGIAGHMAEQALKDRRGYEVIVKLIDGTTRSVVQNLAKDDRPVGQGQCVMVQIQGTYQRVLPDDDSEDCYSQKPGKKHHHRKHHDDDDDDEAS